MNIGLIGYGKMGKMAEAAALSRGHTISLVVDPYAGEERSAKGVPVGRVISGSPDVFIEFTRPDTAAANIMAAAAAGTAVVSGTTGWHEKLPDVSAAVEKGGASLLWATNFSLGVNLFYRIAAFAASLADPFSEYDVGGYESHHNKKADSPSGTAKTLVEQVLGAMTRKRKVLWDIPREKMEEDTIHFTSLRAGSIPGVHSLLFDSPADTIEITHTARNREGFASGAVLAAEWLVREKRRGVFTMDDVLKDMLP